MARAGPRPAPPLALPTLVVAANAPDVDILAYAGGPYFALAFRRGLTHGWPAMLLLPFLVAGAMVLWDRWVRRRHRPGAEPARFSALLALSAAGVATHPTLDWMNSYGMRWRMPLDGSWSYGDALFIIDSWLWLALGGALFLARPRTRRASVLWGGSAVLTSAVVLLAPVPAWVRAAWLAGIAAFAWVGTRGGPTVSSHAAAPLSPGGRGPATGASRAPRAALAFTALYASGLLIADRVARGDVRAASHDAGLEAVDVMIQPLPGTPLRGEVEVSTPDGYVPGTHHWLSDPRVVLHPERMVPRLAYPDALPDSIARRLVDTARRHTDVRHYLTWSRYPLVSVERAGAAWLVRFSDARYDRRLSGGSLSGLEVVVDDAPDGGP